MLCGSITFFFASFLFAYFYLRALNNQHLWKPKHVVVPVGWGTAITACVVASAALVWWGTIDQRRRWLKGSVGLALGLVAIVLQIVTWTQVGFGPTDGGYASVYFGWTSLFFLFVFGSLFWLETILATSYRYSGKAPAQDIEDPAALNTAELAAFTQYWIVVAAVGVLTWIVLYLVS